MWYSCFSEFLHESILEGCIHSLDSSFPLRRISKDELYSELFADSPKLSHEIFVIGGIWMIDLVGSESIQINTLWFSEMRITEVLDPELEGSSYSFIVIKSCYHFPCCIIDSYQETSLSESMFKPQMIASIILDHFSEVFFPLSHHSLNIRFLLFRDDSDISSDQLISESWHRETDRVFFFEFLFHHHIGVIMIVLLYKRDCLIIFCPIILMVGSKRTRLMNESSISVLLISFLDSLDLSETLLSQGCSFSFEKLSGNEFIHNGFEVKFLLSHTKIVSHRIGKIRK